MPSVYLSFVDDRHAETDAEVFDTAEKAIAHARNVAKMSASRPEDYQENPWDVPSYCLFHALYSSEGDNVWVMEKEIR